MILERCIKFVSGVTNLENLSWVTVSVELSGLEIFKLRLESGKKYDPRV